MQALDPAVSKRIAILRFIMIFGVIVLHTPLYVAMKDTGPGLFDAIKAFFQSAVFRCSVSMLTCISGYLLFSDTRLDYRQLVAKKTRTLLIPFLCFNLPVVGLMLLSHAGLIGSLPISTPDMSRPMNVLNAAFGLTAMPVNYPLGFLRDLFVLMLISPVFRWLIGTAPWAGLCVVSLLFFGFNADGPLVLRNEMAVLFYVGALAATQRWNLARLDAYAWPCLALFLGICAFYVHQRIGNTNLLRFIAPLLIWPAASLLVGTVAGERIGKLSKYSFFLFLAHAFVLPVTWLVYNKLGAPLGVPYWAYWLATPVLVCALLIAVHRVAKGGIPLFFNVMTGVRA